jgi:uncharacterized membrane-anchored protein YitT (DUF2179 family)
MKKDAHIVRRFVLVTLGALIFAVNLNTFVKAAGLIPGGMTGISVLVQSLVRRFAGVELPFAPLYYIANAFPVFIGFKFIGFKFTLFSCINVVLTGIFTDLIPGSVLAFLDLTDPLLCAVFGGAASGIAVALCLFADATSGGTDFFAIYFAEKKGRDCWNYIFAANCVMLVAAGIIGSPQAALYSIIFQWTTTTVTSLTYKGYQQRTLLIITYREEEVYGLIRAMTTHDATSFTGKGLYKGEARTLLYSVVSASEVTALLPAIKETDPHAFINVLKTDALLGQFNKRKKD